LKFNVLSISERNVKIG